MEVLQQWTNGQRGCLRGGSHGVKGRTCGPAIVRVKIYRFITDGPQGMGTICYTCIDSFDRSLYPQRAVGSNGEEVSRAKKVLLFLFSKSRKILGREGFFDKVGPITGGVYRVREKTYLKGCMAFDCEGVLGRVASPWCASGGCSSCINSNRRKGHSYM